MPPVALTASTLLQGIDTSDAGVARLFERVRDIPFTFAAHQDPDTLLACGFGTCAPKHALLARLYADLGLETRFISFPPELRRHAHGGVVRGHAALRLRRPHGWIDVDATFDRPLAAAGFIVTEAWDGRTSMPLVVTPISRVESALLPEHEERLLGIDHRTRLPRSVVQGINAWLDTLRSRPSGRPSA